MQRRRPVQVVYKGAAIREPLFIDVLVEDKVLVEVKATEKSHPIYETQVLTYLRLTGIKLGLLVNMIERHNIHPITATCNMFLRHDYAPYLDGQSSK